ncbi:hypothetical protein TrVE_jg885 [Triparma verrucosa]|uniref:Calcineurin-like phosphoesterase domain-containing protein n=1 Tax=Triparma verrucosa TaxID=1606542 RepID=A0A9W7BIW2_9STRA|nr:hypothetical protein TrVE_jg885 [Triparma verrucosa]
MEENPPSPAVSLCLVLTPEELRNYSPYLRNLLVVLDRSQGSGAMQHIIVAVVFFILSMSFSGSLIERSVINEGITLSLIMIFASTKIWNLLEEVFYRRLSGFLGQQKKAFKENRLENLRQSHKYPQLPHRSKQKRYAMLGPTHWFRWQCYVDCIFYKLLGAARAQARDKRLDYKDVKRTFDLSNSIDNGWFDFVADTGDSFAGTFTVASLLVSEINLPGVPSLPPPDLCVHGGDLSYPWPQKHELHNRFVLPLEYTGRGKKKREMFIVPGNHEWDDGLKAFDEMFVNHHQEEARCTQNTVASIPLVSKQHVRVGPYTLPQQSSYFALKLPNNWWLFGIDMVDIEGCLDLDQDQYDYFTKIYEEEVKKSTDSIIIVTHIPDYFWNYCLGYSKGKRLAQLRHSFGTNFRLMLSGDMHFYNRFSANSDPNGPQYLIVGGGGGFGHSTSVPRAESTVSNHPFTDNLPQIPLTRRSAYPKPEQCHRYFNENIFQRRHYGLMKLTGFFYLMIGAGVVSTDLNFVSEKTFFELVAFNAKESVSCFNLFPFLGYILLLAINFVIATANYGPEAKFLLKGGALSLLHTASHFISCFICLTSWQKIFYLLSWEAESSDVFDVAWKHYWQLGLFWITGGIVGHYVSMTYFWVAFNFFSFQWNEAYCTAEDEDHKNFIRCKIGLDGAIDIYVIGIDKSCMRWKERVGRKDGDAFLEPQGGEHNIQPKLVEVVRVLPKPK